jgi:hypothetical protein
MPRASGQKDYLSLIKGLNTESSALTFPESFTADELNFIVDKDGLIRKRRLGFEELVTPFTVTRNEAEIENVFYWRGPSIVCVIVTDATPQTAIRFHAVDADFTFISETIISSSAVKTQIAETTNYLAITTDTGDSPVLCKYTETTKEITLSNINLHVRDFELVDDGLQISNNPTTLTDNHKYNLFNVDWHLIRPDAESSHSDKRVLTAYFDYTGVYPSNAQVASIGIIINSSGDTEFSSKDVEGANFGNSKAGRGHYVYNVNAFDRDARMATPNIDGAPSTTLTPLGSTSFPSIPTYNPDTPTDPTNPDGGGGIPPYEPFDDLDIE